MALPAEGKGAIPRRSVTIIVRGTPSPGGSKSAFALKGSGRIVVVDAGGKRTKAWRERVAHEAASVMRGQPHFAPPLALAIEFRLARPKAHYLRGKLRADAPRLHTIRPDATKLLRSTEDALTGVVWRDDAGIARQRVGKSYADSPDQVGAAIIVEELGA